MTTPKTVKVTNKGSIPIVVRVSYEEYWKNRNNEDLPLTDKNGNTIAIINFNKDINWHKIGDYYYYLLELESGETTSSLIESVTFNPDYEITGTTVSNLVETDEDGDGINDTKTITYVSSSDSHLGGKYHLDINVETIQADQAESEWGVNIDNLKVTAIKEVFTYDKSSSSVTIKDYDPDKGGTNVEIPNTIEGLPVTKIDDEAFKDNGIVGTVEIPSSVKVIGNESFANNGIEEVVLSDGLEEIHDKAFVNNKLTSIKIPETVTTLAKDAFEGNDVVIPPAEQPSSCFTYRIYASGAAITGYDEATCGTDVVIPKTIDGHIVTSIEMNAFKNKQLTSVVIPTGVTSIGQYAFQNNQLTSVTIPDSVTTIGNGAFCVNELTNVTIPNSVTTIGGSAFADNYLTNIIIPDSVTSIGDGAFQNNELTNVIISNSITSIKNYTFYNNQLTSVTIPDSVISIGWSAFYKNKLTSIEIPNSVTAIGDSAFGENQLTNVEISSSVTTIEESAFMYNKLTSVEIPSSVTNLASNAFDSSVVITRK